MTGFTHESSAATVPVEWYTPPEIFDALGITFDLDPCHPNTPTCVPAHNKITPPQDGLIAQWHGNIWLNPPYGKQTQHWLQRLTEHGNGIALVFARTDAAWFQHQLRNATAICFIAGRVKFINGQTGQPAGSPGAGSALIAYGTQNAAALHHSALGTTITLKP